MPETNFPDDGATAPIKVTIFEDDEPYTTAEAAQRMKKSKAWFERARWDGSGPPYSKVGRTVLYLGKHLNEYVAARIRQSTTETA